MRCLLCVFLLGAPAWGQAGKPVAAPDAFLQRVVEFFAPEDARIPAAVRQRLAPQGRRLELSEALRNRRAGIPVAAESITTVVRAGDGAYWLGSNQGAMRCGLNPAERCDYFASRRWLPDDEVLGIYPQSERLVWIRTRTGVSRLQFRPMTLEEKTRPFEERVRLRHNRYGLLGTSELTRPGDLSSNRMFPTDNDGLWTAIYVGAESFRFAATRDPEARRLARDSLSALLKLEQITGIPGFPARAYIRKGDYRHPGGEWHTTPDGQYEWKGDTSSDEIVGHFFAYSVYYDLVLGGANVGPGPAWRGPGRATDTASRRGLKPRPTSPDEQPDEQDDEQEKRLVRAVVARILDHILAHDRYLVDVDGRATTWGKWSPEYFRTKPPEGIGWCDAPLNSLELLSFLRTTHHITGDSRYLAEYHKLVKEGYARTAALYRQRRAQGCELNYSDEELAMLSFHPLFEYEQDPKLRAIYLDALEQWWENIRREESSLWIYIYSRATGKGVDLNQARRTLVRYPMDLVDWTIRNSHRRDIRPDKDLDRSGRPQILDLLPPDERPVMRWNANPFRVDGGGGGRGEDDGAAFLLPYWMGRYYGYVR